MEFLVAQWDNNLPACGRHGFIPWVGKILWRRKWQPTPVAMNRGAWQSMGLQESVMT